jgi:16S rRNA U516 pseudouridylate synthase RsuA-like enzyme
MRGKDIFPSRTQMQRLVKSGRAALEHRLIRAIALPLDSQNIEVEMEEIRALLHKYNEVMAVYEKPKTTPAPKTSSDENGSKA